LGVEPFINGWQRDRRIDRVGPASLRLEFDTKTSGYGQEQPMGLMDGKQGLIFGVANERSYATHIASSLHEQGATCAYAYLPGQKNKRRVAKALESIGQGEPWLAACDAGSDEDLDAVFDRYQRDFGRLDFLVHSIAFADREALNIGGFHATGRQTWNRALEISSYTLPAMAKRAAALMSEGGSIVSMSYYGAEKVVPGYNVMGIAKAALEHATRYLAAELGVQGIRVNAISGGPLRTLAAMAVGGIDLMCRHHAHHSPLRRNIEGPEVGNTAVYLLSDLSSGVTGEVIHVDCGFHVLSCNPTCDVFAQTHPARPPEPVESG
jgi:enoyl-[acyl-carrier protein] reductase I